MRCEEFFEDLSAYADGELPSEGAALVENHLEGCAACRKVVEEYRALHRLLGTEADVEPSAGFPAEVRRRARSLPASPVRRRLLPGLAAAAASVLLLLGLMFMGSRDGGPGERGTPSPGDERGGAAAFTEVEKAVEQDPELLEILESLDALEKIELLENLPLLERLEEFESGEADALSREAEILLPDREIPLDVEEEDR